jgi:L-threonylcarbamoyladenylate synthase
MKLSLKRATELIREGHVVAIPTETVYGLAISLDHPLNIKKVYKLKNRPKDNPLIVHIANYQQLEALVQGIPERFKKLKKFWPGPLTVVFKANLKTVPTAIRAGLKTVAIRMPSHPQLLKLIRQTGPLAAPSANPSGRPSATKAEHVKKDLGNDFPVLDGGACAHGVESTIISLNNEGWQLLRLGAISQDELELHIGKPDLPNQKSKKPQVPGQKYRHYAPKAKLKLCLDDKAIKKLSQIKKYDAVLGFSDSKTRLPVISLGRRNYFRANLKCLYSALRRVDTLAYKNVLVDLNFKDAGLGITLRERLTKAAGS